MQILAFRITNFRSIVDSDWVQFSPDGITVLVGQNESGKTSVLEALHCALSAAPITPDDKRVNAPDPIIYLRIRTDSDQLHSALDEYDDVDIGSLTRFLATTDDIVELECHWTAKPGGSALTEFNVSIGNPDVFDIHMDHAREADAFAKGGNKDATSDTATSSESPGTPKAAIDSSGVGDLLHDLLPSGTLFNAESGLLPNTVDLDAQAQPTGKGATAAKNFLAIAEIHMPDLLAGDGRFRQNVLNRANKKVSDDFTSYWSQLIGSNAKLNIQCQFEHYGLSVPEKVGKPYLEFWISDGNTQLYPKQRSLGVRWFIS